MLTYLYLRRADLVAWRGLGDARISSHKTRRELIFFKETVTWDFYMLLFPQESIYSRLLVKFRSRLQICRDVHKIWKNVHIWTCIICCLCANINMSKVKTLYKVCKFNTLHILPCTKFWFVTFYKTFNC